MRKLFLVTIVAIASLMVANASNDKPITVEQLPVKAQQFIKQHFANSKVSYAMMDDEYFDKSYDVVFADGEKIEFDKKGEWKEVKCKYSEVPAGIVPAKIAMFIKSNHDGQKVTEIERRSRSKGYQVTLSSGLEIEFNKNFQVIGYDD